MDIARDVMEIGGSANRVAMVGPTCGLRRAEEGAWYGCKPHLGPRFATALLYFFQQAFYRMWKARGDNMQKDTSLPRCDSIKFLPDEEKNVFFLRQGANSLKWGHK